MIINKNLITKDEEGWLIEIFEYKESGTNKPLYSVWDIVKSKKEARSWAKILNRDNADKLHYEYLEIIKKIKKKIKKEAIE